MQNEEWKDVRKRFNPGFAPKHLMTLLPVLVGKVGPFIKILDNFVRTKESFSLDEITTNLTFDIIGAVTMGEDMEAQHLDPAHQGELIRNFKAIVKSVCIPNLDCLNTHYSASLMLRHQSSRSLCRQQAPTTWVDDPIYTFQAACSRET